MRLWLAALDVETLFIEPGSPWENGYVESFNGKLRDELLDREIFFTLAEAAILIERWRREYNTVRPHSALGYRPPAPAAIMRGDARERRNESSSEGLAQPWGAGQWVAGVSGHVLAGVAVFRSIGSPRGTRAFARLIRKVDPWRGRSRREVESE